MQYGKDQYDRERYAELRQIAAAADRMIAVTAAVRHSFRICMVPAPDFPASTRGKTFCNRVSGPKTTGRSANRPDRIALRLAFLFFCQAYCVMCIMQYAFAYYTQAWRTVNGAAAKQPRCLLRMRCFTQT
ncbi:MAG: NUDIX hydrolase N-terminal domain-containing protein [Acutalibacteraceae bacterium]